MSDQIRIGQVIDALIAIAGSIEGFRLSDDPSTRPNEELVTVWDGPEWTATEDHAPGGHIVIGWAGGRDSESAVAETTWTAGPIAASVRPRDESTTITCAALSDRRDTAKEARDEALDIASVFGRICRALPDLGLDTSATIGGVRTSVTLSAGSFSQWNNRGYAALMEFSLTYETRV